jgi:hypothetical protein
MPTVLRHGSDGFTDRREFLEHARSTAFERIPGFRSNTQVLSYGAFLAYDSRDNSIGLTRGLNIYGPRLIGRRNRQSRCVGRVRLGRKGTGTRGPTFRSGVLGPLYWYGPEHSSRPRRTGVRFPSTTFHGWGTRVPSRVPRLQISRQQRPAPLDRTATDRCTR